MNNNYDEFIINFYNHPKDIDDKDIDKIEKILDHYKREIVDDKYILLVASDDIISKLFILFLYYYDQTLKPDKENKHHCGLDFEFGVNDNIREVALMQLNFEKYLWVVDPKKYDLEKRDIINDKLFFNNKVYKVLHGSDALDLPYMYDTLFDNDQEKILKFMKKFIDTRFLCEYVRSSLNEEGKCSIYDSMLYFGTIDQTKYDELMKINEAMGPIWDVQWDIKKMSTVHLKYAFYDVLQLIDCLKDIYKKITNDTPDYIRTYYYIIEIIRFVIMERKGATKVLELAKSVVNPINNYLVKSREGNITLIQKFNKVMENEIILKDDKGDIYVNFIDKLNYVKGAFVFLLKYILYYVCSKKYQVYKNKNEIMKDNINIDDLYNEIEKIKMYKLLKFLKLYESNIKNKI